VIYNIFDYLENELPGESIYINLYGNTYPQTEIPDRSIHIQETGGSETAWFQFKTLTLQIIAKDIDGPNARELIYSVDNVLNNKFGLELPSISVNGVLYPGFKIGQISSISRPQSIGLDDNNRAIFSSNYKFLF
jgi:hypothetical protein